MRWLLRRNIGTIYKKHKIDRNSCATKQRFATSFNPDMVKWCCLRVPCPSMTAPCMELTRFTLAFKACYVYASSLAFSHPPFVDVCGHNLSLTYIPFFPCFYTKSAELLTCFSLFLNSIKGIMYLICIPFIIRFLYILPRITSKRMLLHCACNLDTASNLTPINFHTSIFLQAVGLVFHPLYSGW